MSSTIQDRATELVELFTRTSSWEDRYKEMIKFGKTLDQMPEEYKIDDNKVKGCQSQVWLFAKEEEGSILFYADSDASIAKGIIALLLKVYSGATPREILDFDGGFIEELGLKQHLSMSRANGLASMLKQIKIYAFAFAAKMAN